MTKSYLAWPVKLKGDLSHLEAHLTLKYLGTAPYAIADLAERLKGHRLEVELGSAYWSAEVFGESYVMVLEGLDPALYRARAAVADICPDDFPEWRPHITFNKLVWSFIAQGNLRPHQIVERVDPLTLFIDKEAFMLFYPESVL